MAIEAGHRFGGKNQNKFSRNFLQIQHCKMANSRKISYLEAFQAYQEELELFKERQRSKGKN